MAARKSVVKGSPKKRTMKLSWIAATKEAFADHKRSHAPFKEGKTVLAEARNLHFRGIRAPLPGGSPLKKAKSASKRKAASPKRKASKSPKRKSASPKRKGMSPKRKSM